MNELILFSTNNEHGVDIKSSLSTLSVNIYICNDLTDLPEINRNKSYVILFDAEALDNAEQIYVSLLQENTLITKYNHYSILLSNIKNIKNSYSLCKNGVFNDYTVLWPAYDANYLPFLVKNCFDRIKKNIAYNNYKNILELIESHYNELPISFTIDYKKLLTEYEQQYDKKIKVQERIKTRSKSGKKILIVDDDPIYQEALSTILNETKCEIFLADNAEVAFSYVQNKSINLIFVDFQMPKVNGIEFIQKVRPIYGYEKIPIIMLTGNNLKETVKNALNAGVSDYIIKPSNKKEILRKAIKFLGQS